jgi:hypothetical protein
MEALMTDTSSAISPIQRFFENHELLSSKGDIPALVSLYADSFLAAGPQGAKCVRSADFALALPKRKQLFESLGSQSATLVGLEETPLDARYVMARTKWKMIFVHNEAEPQQVFVDSTFIVDTVPDGFKIILYLANQDIMEILKERGILSA